jgi:hypothetical protein
VIDGSFMLFTGSDRISRREEGEGVTRIGKA